MAIDVGREVAALRRMMVKQLWGKYREEFGEASTTGHKTSRARRIAWRLQALGAGTLGDSATTR